MSAGDVKQIQDFIIGLCAPIVDDVSDLRDRLGDPKHAESDGLAMIDVLARMPVPGLAPAAETSLTVDELKEIQYFMAGFFGSIRCDLKDIHDRLCGG